MSGGLGVLFRRAAELATEYRRAIGDRPQRPEHGYAAALPDWEAPTPEAGLPAEAVLEELVRRATPGLHASTGPRFFGWVIGGSHPAGVVADWMVSARGFSTWAMLRHFGREGLAELVARNCRQARLIADAVAAEAGISVLNAVVLNQVILRFGGDDALTLATIARLQQDGVAFAGGSQWRGQWVMRVSVSSYATTDADAARTAEAIRAAWRAIRGQNFI